MFGLKLLNNIITKRFYNTSNNVMQIVSNRNPRNLEKMRIAYKPSGYFLEKPGRCYWHKLKLNVSERHVTASIEHFENGAVVTASSKEWAIKKQLYRTYDTSAFINVARVLAQRCHEAGITEIRNDSTKGNKVGAFLKVLQDSGIVLNESEQYRASRPWDMDRPEKPWEITE